MFEDAVDVRSAEPPPSKELFVCYVRAVDWGVVGGTWAGRGAVFEAAVNASAEGASFFEGAVYVLRTGE